ncbi:ankyrin-1 [Cajanus cajan]|uniref:Ankyrin-3 n=1 Tax=Cajanus cajan TaxID=3821 RepID=A0A151QQE7_CAJCA|nr:ankyrin-1 [Cajanus cajan]KYP32527.1 Ankyrin-3 [Cajanus cajan]
MDRLIRLEPSSRVVMRVEEGQKCEGKITLRNVMHTMPVAFRLQPLNKTRYTVKPQTGIISPLATLTIHITCHHLPPSTLPLSPDSFLLHSALAPGAAITHPSSMLDALPADWFRKKQLFTDSALKLIFVGSHIAAHLVAHAAMDDIRHVLENSDPSWRLVDSADPQGQTLLHLAVSQGRADLVQLLLEFGPRVDAPDRCGSTPLEAAASCNEGLIVELLLAHRAQTERSESSVFGPIHHAARGGHVEVLRLLLLKGASVDSLTKDGSTALHLAVEEQRRDCVRLLLANHARTDVKNAREGDTPLHVASAIGDESMVNLLLQKGGASKYVRNGHGKTAYEVAVENGHARLFDVLRLGDKLCVAARKGEVRSIQKLLDKGAGMNGRDQNGWTALHRASFKGRVEAVRALVERGVDVDAKDEEGYTALHCAAESGHVDVTEFLVKKGARVEARTRKGVSALQIAESLHYVGITRVLVNGGASREHSNVAALGAIDFGNKMELGDGGGMKMKKTRGGRRGRVLNGGGFSRSLALAVL